MPKDIMASISSCFYRLFVLVIVPNKLVSVEFILGDFMAGINKVILVGNLGKDPELRTTQDGQKVCSFSIATSEAWTDKSGQKQEKTEWHRVTVWGRQAENCAQYLSKGRQVYVEGKLSYRQWDDKETGQKKYATDIIANTIQFLGGNAGANTTRTTNQEAPTATTNFEDSNFSSDNDIPF
jgi:single-strand DNA-binding protein